MSARPDTDRADREERDRPRRPGRPDGRPGDPPTERGRRVPDRTGRGGPGRDGRRPPPSAVTARRRRRWAVVAVLVLVVGGVAGVTLGSPWLDVEEVQVVGAAPETRAAVEDAAAVPAGTSLVWLDGDLTGGGIAERVRALPRVAGVDVTRRWPHTLEVAVAEREPVLAVPGAPDGVSLVDASGFAYRTIPVAPRGTPVLRLPPGAAAGPEDPSTLAAVRVLGSLPPDLRRRVAEVRASGAFDVALALTDGRTARWGADADNPRKAAVLRALLTRPGSVYDVSSPDLAVVR